MHLSNSYHQWIPSIQASSWCFPPLESDYPTWHYKYRCFSCRAATPAHHHVTLRTHAFSLLQYHPFIPSTPKFCVFRKQPNFYILASQTRHQFYHEGALCFEPPPCSWFSSTSSFAYSEPNWFKLIRQPPSKSIIIGIFTAQLSVQHGRPSPIILFQVLQFPIMKLCAQLFSMKYRIWGEKVNQSRWLVQVAKSICIHSVLVTCFKHEKLDHAFASIWSFKGGVVTQLVVDRNIRKWYIVTWRRSFPMFA